MKPEDYTIEYCPWCDQEVAIHAHGITRCPKCGVSLAPCTVCQDERGGCYDPCPYGCRGTDADADKPVTMPDMTSEEIAFAWANY